MSRLSAERVRRALRGCQAAMTVADSETTLKVTSMRRGRGRSKISWRGKRGPLDRRKNAPLAYAREDDAKIYFSARFAPWPELQSESPLAAMTSGRPPRPTLRRMQPSASRHQSSRQERRNANRPKVRRISRRLRRSPRHFPKILAIVRLPTGTRAESRSVISAPSSPVRPGFFCACMLPRARRGQRGNGESWPARAASEVRCPLPVAYWSVSTGASICSGVTATPYML